MNKKNAFATAAALTLTASMLFAGCASGTTAQTTGQSTFDDDGTCTFSVGGAASTGDTPVRKG